MEQGKYSILMNSLREYVNANNFAGIVLGLSGGIDSALSMVIAADALGSDKVHSVMMPSQYTSKDSVNDAQQCAEISQVKFNNMAIDEFYSPILNKVKLVLDEELNGLTQENIQARIRAVILMTISNQTNKVLLATGNKSEAYTGYCTLYGDTCGGYAILRDVYKTEVYRLSRWRNNNIPDGALNNKSAVIPDNILTKAPSAELKHYQKDSDNLPDYHILDRILSMLIERKMSIDEIIGQGYDSDIVKKIAELYKKSAYKRDQSPSGPKIS
ncbi:MAG: NAD(+) synthase [Rickettsiaceae bacterium H1]|nr:NAD(+) synthase [Rickettsiaceae bacterium H1]